MPLGHFEVQDEGEIEPRRADVPRHACSSFRRVQKEGDDETSDGFQK